MAGSDRENDGTGNSAASAEGVENVVRFPGDWVGPLGELVPLRTGGRPVRESAAPDRQPRRSAGPSLRAVEDPPATPDLLDVPADVPVPIDGDAFWGETSELVQQAVAQSATAVEGPQPTAVVASADRTAGEAVTGGRRRRRRQAARLAGGSAAEPTRRARRAVVRLAALIIVLACVSFLANSTPRHDGSGTPRVATPLAQTAIAKITKATKAVGSRRVAARTVVRTGVHAAINGQERAAAGTASRPAGRDAGSESSSGSTSERSGASSSSGMGSAAGGESGSVSGLPSASAALP